MFKIVAPMMSADTPFDILSVRQSLDDSIINDWGRIFSILKVVECLPLAVRATPLQIADICQRICNGETIAIPDDFVSIMEESFSLLLSSEYDIDIIGVVRKALIPIKKPASTKKTVSIKKPASTKKPVSIKNPVPIKKHVPIKKPVPIMKPMTTKKFVNNPTYRLHR